MAAASFDIPDDFKPSLVVERAAEVICFQQSATYTEQSPQRENRLLTFPFVETSSDPFMILEVSF